MVLCYINQLVLLQYFHLINKIKLPITGTLNLAHMVVTLKFNSQILSSFFIARFSVRVARAAARD